MQLDATVAFSTNTKIEVATVPNRLPIFESSYQTPENQDTASLVGYGLGTSFDGDAGLCGHGTDSCIRQHTPDVSSSCRRGKHAHRRGLTSRRLPGRTNHRHIRPKRMVQQIKSSRACLG
jgi:hypothetical protein